jgi:8-oxo-dGTP pyrophosphatase MutT (NUDIX family)
VIEAIDDVRHVARVVLTNRAGDAWLIKALDPAESDRPPFWFTPGGKIDPGETPEVAGCRELFEETGVLVSPESLGAPISREDVLYRFDGKHYRQIGVFYHVAIDAMPPGPNALSESEKRYVLDARWWSQRELMTTTEVVYPADLAELLVRCAP